MNQQSDDLKRLAEAKQDQAFCPSYFDKDNNLKDCTCGKCGFKVEPIKGIDTSGITDQDELSLLPGAFRDGMSFVGKETLEDGTTLITFPVKELAAYIKSHTNQEALKLLDRLEKKSELLVEQDPIDEYYREQNYIPLAAIAAERANYED